MSEFKPELGFEDCWSQPRSARTQKSPGGAQVRKASGRTAPGDKSGAGGPQGRRGAAGQAQTISGSDKARLARVVKGAPEVMVKVSKPARVDKHGNPIEVSRGTEALRVMTTYGNAVRILAQSRDPEGRQLAEATRKFSARLTDVTTQRGQRALILDIEGMGRGLGRRKGGADFGSRERDQERGAEGKAKRNDRARER